MGSIRETADKLFAGELPIREHHPLSFTGESEEVADGVMLQENGSRTSAPSKPTPTVR